MSVLSPSAPRQTGARRLAAKGVFNLIGLRWLLLGGLLLARLSLSLTMIRRPGLQYDETLFVHAARLYPGDSLPFTFHGVPLMIFPYIGALKSWLYIAILKVFGTSALAIRLPAVLIVTVGLVILYLGLRDLVNRPVAILAFAALCFDNSIFWLTRDDVGPSALEFFFKCVAVFCASRFARERSSRWVWVLLVALALGVFNKLNFIWVVNATTAISVLLAVRYRRSLPPRRVVGQWFAGLAFIYIAFGIYYFHSHIGTVGGPATDAIGQPWGPFRDGMESILSGTWFYQYALAPIGSHTFIAMLVLALFVIGALASVFPWNHRSVAVGSFTVIAVLVAVQTLLTPQATAGWHYVSVYPFVTIVAAYGVYAVARAILRRGTAVYVALGCAAAGALVYDGALMSTYMRTLASKEPTNAGWTPAIYQLSRVIRHTPGTIFTADWGISNPLFTLQPSLRYDEVAFDLSSPTSQSLDRLDKLIASTPGPKLFVTHAAGKVQLSGVNQNLFHALGGHLRFAGSVPGRDGKPVFVLYDYR